MAENRAKPPLNEWLSDNGYNAKTVELVKSGTAGTALVEKLKRIRREAQGQNGNLSRRQRARIHGGSRVDGHEKWQGQRQAECQVAGRQTQSLSRGLLRFPLC